MSVEETIEDKQRIDSDDLKTETIHKYGRVTEYGGPELDFEFIYEVVENLSNVIKKFPKGREFGTPGEHYARDLLIGWMNEIGLQNVNTEKITGKYTKKDSWQGAFNFFLDPDYHLDGWIEDLDLKKNYTKWYLLIKIYNNGGELVDNRYFSPGNCFPFMKEETRFGCHNVTLNNVTVYDDFNPFGNDRIVLIESDWWNNYDWWIYNVSKLKKRNVKGFILMDHNDETFFMLPSGTSSPLRPRFSKPGISINGSSGKWIKKYLNNPNYTVKADLCCEWEWQYVDSWNVIGEIPGNSSQIAIINNFYDGWWNQATFDEAVGIGVILGVAKYIIENNIKPELTLKFIFWGGHEWYFRGAKHYLKTHNIRRYGKNNWYNLNDDLEDILYVICPGNIGFNKTNDMHFNVGHKRDAPLQKFMQSVARELKYTERTGIDITGDFSVHGEETYQFYHGHYYPERYCKHAVEIDRWPYPGYHRDDGENHEKGDVFSDINDSLYRVDCEVIAEIILRLTIPKFEVKITRPLENSFYIRNKRICFLPRRTIVFGLIDITVENGSEAEIEKVEFYIDNRLKETDTTVPYSYRWRPHKLFRHAIKVVAYDKDGNYAEDEIKVW